MSAVLTIITGPMFSGKTRELADYIQTYHIAGLKTLVIKPSFDDRTIETIASRASHSFTYQAFAVHDEAEARAILADPESAHNVLIIDEAQFFGDWIISLVREVIEMKAGDSYEVVIAGLDMDHRGEPFGPMPELLALSDHVIKLKAVCGVCKTVPKNAIFSKKIAGNMDAQSEIGDADKYIAACRMCY